MRYGLYVAAQHPEGANPGRYLSEHLEQVRFARDSGFDSVFAGQHFLSAPFQMLQPTPLLARLAAESGDLTIGSGIFLAVSPWLFGFSDEVKWPHVILGLFEIAAAAMTDPRPIDERRADFNQMAPSR